MKDSTYGSDQHGLIWGYRFAQGTVTRPITSEAAFSLLADTNIRSTPDFFWLHFALANASSAPWLRQNLDLPPAFLDSFRIEAGSTRLEQDGNFLLAVIHDVLFDSAFDAETVGSMCLCIGPRLLLSARLRPLRSVDQLRASVRAERAFRSPVELLAHLLRDQASVLADIIRQSTARVDLVEDRLLANRIASSRSELGTLRRSLVRLQRLLAPEPASLFRLLNKPPEWIADEDLQDLQQAAEEFSVAIADSLALVERAKLIQEELAALMDERTGRTLFVLTVVTVLALPINLVAGLFGMNVGGIPLASHTHGFTTIVGSLISLTVILAYVAFGRRRE